MNAACVFIHCSECICSALQRMHFCCTSACVQLWQINDALRACTASNAHISEARHFKPCKNVLKQGRNLVILDTRGSGSE